MLLSCTNRAISASVIGCAFPSIRYTSCSGGVRAFRRNIHRCGMKFRVTPLSGLYRRIFISPRVLYQSDMTRAKRIVRSHKFETHTLRFSRADDNSGIANSWLPPRCRGRRDLYSWHKEDIESESLSVWFRVFLKSRANDSIRQPDCRFGADFASVFRSCDVRLVHRFTFPDPPG